MRAILKDAFIDLMPFVAIGGLVGGGIAAGLLGAYTVGIINIAIAVALALRTYLVDIRRQR